METITKIKIGVIAAIIVITLIVFFQNNDPITVKVLWFELTLAGSILFLLLTLLGVGIGWAGSALWRWKKKAAAAE